MKKLFLKKKSEDVKKACKIFHDAELIKSQVFILSI